MAQAGTQPAVLVCPSSYLQTAQAFGIWGLEDRSTPVKRAIEEHLDTTINYYLKAGRPAELVRLLGFRRRDALL